VNLTCINQTTGNTEHKSRSHGGLVLTGFAGPGWLNELGSWIT